MRTYALLFTLFTLIASSVDAAETTFGNGVHLNETTAISAILNNPDAYIGKTVKISGMILEACARRGC